tara:strand:+ start:22675 stop:23151 length:477 start_codon:yes stop_codon:yes gene_type:complete
MNPTLEQILYLQAQEDGNALVTPELAVALGALAGGGSGLYLGNKAHQLGRQINNVKDMVSPVYETEKAKFSGVSRGKPNTYAKKTSPIPRNKRIGPGNRMAGLVLGSILGGLAGPEVRKQAVGESEAARLLAKIQIGAPLTTTERQVLENVATKQYMA